jgi:hypothetical protein
MPENPNTVLQRNSPRGKSDAITCAKMLATSTS